MPHARNKELLMSKGMLSIFRKPDVAKSNEPPESRLAAALYGPVTTRPAPPVAAAVPPLVVAELPRAKLVFAFDATASRDSAWRTSTALTDALLAALPGQLDVALAVHGGGKLHTFTRFERDASKLRERAAGVRCEAGRSCLLDILVRALEVDGVGTVLYVGDVFEESHRRARKLAASLAARQIRLIILHDAPHPSQDDDGADIFAEMTSLTGGCVLPFDASALPRLRDLLSAVAVLAVGGTPLLAAKQETMPAARLLLEHLKGNKS
jgi:hypothetical protein